MNVIIKTTTTSSFFALQISHGRRGLGVQLGGWLSSSPQERLSRCHRQCHHHHHYHLRSAQSKRFNALWKSDGCIGRPELAWEKEGGTRVGIHFSTFHICSNIVVIIFQHFHSQDMYACFQIHGHTSHKMTKPKRWETPLSFTHWPLTSRPATTMVPPATTGTGVKATRDSEIWLLERSSWWRRKGRSSWCITAQDQLIWPTATSTSPYILD